MAHALALITLSLESDGLYILKFFQDTPHHLETYFNKQSDQTAQSLCCSKNYTLILKFNARNI